MKRVEFVVGDQWQHDVRYLDELRPYRPADTQPNLAEIGDIIDLVVGSKNITASISEESIFPFVAELCEMIVDLAEGRRNKAIVEFRREPWELVIVPDGEGLALTIYSVDDDARVVVHDAMVEAVQFARAVGDAAQQLLGDLFAISETFGSDPFVRRFSAYVGRLKRLDTFKPGNRSPDRVRERAASTSTGSGWTLSYGVDIGGPGFVDYDGEQPYDLHALLIPGFVLCEWAGREVVLCQDYPVLAVRGLVQRARELLNAMESERARFRCDDHLPRGTLDVSGGRTSWRVRAGDEELLECDLQPQELLDCLVTFAELLLEDLEAANPSLQLNFRFSKMQEEVESLRAWLGDFGGSNTYLESPEDYLRANGNVRPAEVSRPSPEFHWPFRSVRRLHPTEAWRFESAQIHFGSISTTRGIVLVPTSEALFALDTISGGELWSVGASATKPSSYAIAGSTVVVAFADGMLQLHDLETGKLLAATRGVGTFVVDAAYYPGSDLIVVALFHGAVVAINRRSGRVAWRRESDERMLSGAMFEGPLATTLTSTGVLSSCNPLTGQDLWRVRIGGSPDGGPHCHRGRLYTFSHDETTRALTVHAVFPYTGRVAWQLRIEGWLAGHPSFVDDILILPVERYGRVTLHGIPLEELRPDTHWMLELTSAGLDRPTPVRGCVMDGERHGLVRTDRSDMTAFRLADGEVRWRVQTDPKTTLLYRNVDVDVVRDAVVSVGDSVQLRCLQTGELLHRFGGTMIAPEYAAAVGSLGVIVGEPGAEESSPDELVRHELGHYLAVVE